MDNPLPADADTTHCTDSATAFRELGVEDGTALVTRTYDDLVADGVDAYEPGDAFLERVAAVFRVNLAELSGAAALPPDVDAALDDARYWTRVELEEVSMPALRTDVLPRFSLWFARFYCQYRGRQFETT